MNKSNSKKIKYLQLGESFILSDAQLRQIAKLIYQALTRTFSITPKFTYSRKMKLDKCVVYNITIKEKIDEILDVLELVDEEGYQIFPQNIIADGENLRAFIASLFLASGSVNSPSSDNYHLQMVVNDDIARRKKYVVYLKKADQISNFLAVVYANVNMMNFESARIDKDYINSDNRWQICFNANFQKTLAKANEQIEDIKIIEARMENQEAPLSELVSIIQEKNGLSISKSGLSRIFTNLHDLANKLRRE